MNRVPSVLFVIGRLGLGRHRRRRLPDRNGPTAPETKPAAVRAPGAATRPLRIAVIAKSASNPSFVASRLGAEKPPAPCRRRWGGRSRSNG